MEKNSEIKIMINLLIILAGSLVGSPAAAQSAQKPNIIVILADDIGFSDIGCYGSEIGTPNLDRLASNGVRFSQFYNTARCCPTRASVLTGLYPHQAGVGYMVAPLGESTAYQGHLRHDRKTIAQLMKEGGYTTLHVGKWHVGNENNKTEPCDVGFDRSWSRKERIHYWDMNKIYEDGVTRKSLASEQKYLTDLEGEKAIEYIDYAVDRKAPFFMYLAFNAAHWPLHAKPEDIAKYRGKFMKGWDRLREERIQRLDAMGMVKAVPADKIKDAAVPSWNDIPAGDQYPGYHAMTSGKHDQDDWDLKMAVYAAQIDCMDQNIGRIIERLEEKGVFDNTIIIYLQDNGACPEGIGKNDEQIPGGADSYSAYHMPWAHLGNTPFRMYKHFLHEGGISTPFIFHWPAGMDAGIKGSIETGSFGHIIDILPTCLDAAGIRDLKIDYKLEGQSLLPAIKGMNDNSERTVAWEHEGNRAIRKGKWKLISRYEEDVQFFKAWEFPRKPREKEWELYNIEEDRWEMKEVSEWYPAIVKELKAEYEAYYKKIGAIPRRDIIQGTQFKH